MTVSTTGKKRVVLALGLLLLLASVLLTPAVLQSKLGAANLSWGPSLFRVLLAWHGALLILAGRLPWAHAFRDERREPVSLLAWIALFGLVDFALALRLWKLDSCLWLDEVLTMLDYGRAPLGAVLTDFSSQNQHMLYSLLANISVRFFGEHAWSLRLPSVLFGVGSIWALFLLSRRLLPTSEALGACALMTFSYHHVWFSQNARGYMGLLFFALLGTYLWREALERDTWPLWIAYASTCALGAWVHMTMLFVVAAHVVVYLLFQLRSNSPESRSGLRPLAAFTLCGTLALQLHALALPTFFQRAIHETSVASSKWTSPLWAARELLASLSLGFAGTLILLLGAAVVITGIRSIARKEPDTVLAMILPGIVGGGVMLASGHNIWPRFFFFLMGFCLLICVHGGGELARHFIPQPHAGFATIAGVCLVVAASITTLPRCYALPKQDFTGARDFLARELPPAQKIAAVGLANHAYRYYAPGWDKIDTEAGLRQLLTAKQDVALVYTLPIELEGFHPTLWKSVRENFDTWRVFPGTLGGGEVFVCRPKLARVAQDQHLQNSRGLP